MKLLTNYCKELKIASRGFYFYMEFVVALVCLVALMLLVPTDPTSVKHEIIYLDISQQQKELFLSHETEGMGRNVKVEDTKVKLKPQTIVYYDDETGEQFEKKYTDKITVMLETYYYYDAENGKHTQTKYIAADFDTMLRVAYTEKWYGATMRYSEDGREHYTLILSGSETEKFKNIYASMYGEYDISKVYQTQEQQTIRLLGDENTLNNRQIYLPLITVMMNGLMGMMVVIAYIAIDKGEGLIKATAVTPTKTKSYLLSKVLVVMTTSIVSAAIIVLPIMKFDLNYPLFFLTVICTSLLSCCLGLIIASFFKDIKSAFGVIIIVMLLLMLPGFTQIIPGFYPVWAKVMPTFYMLESIKETLLPITNITYVLYTCLGMFILAMVLLLFSERFYKKQLGV